MICINSAKALVGKFLKMYYVKEHFSNNPPSYVFLTRALSYFSFVCLLISCSEANDDSGPKTISDLAAIPATVSEKGSISGQTTNIDEEGFSVPPQEPKPAGEDNSFDTSSDTDSGMFEIFHLKLKKVNMHSKKFSVQPSNS